MIVAGMFMLATALVMLQFASIRDAQPEYS
jgi:hypothetical protein